MTPRAASTPSPDRGDLLAAMTATVASRGYRETSVADVLGRAGIARSRFYSLYANKQRCFDDAVAGIVEEGVAAVRAAIAGTGSPQERMRAPLAALLELVAARPDAARVAFIEAHAAGPEAADRRRAALDAFAGTLADHLRGGHDETLDRTVPLAVCGGIESAIVRHVRERREAELPALATPLAEWAVRHCALTCSPLRLPEAAPLTAGGRGGRAPGSLEPVAPSGRRGLPPGPKRQPRDAIAQTLRNRLLDATTTIVAEDGYGALTVASIVARAATSRRSFYEHFGSIAEAFAAALRRGAEAAAATTLMAYAAPRDPAVGTVLGLDALATFLVDEPAFATAALGTGQTAGLEAFVVRDETLGAFAAVVRDAHRRIRGADHPHAELVARVTAGGIFAVCSEEVRDGRLRDLRALVPALAAIALAPVVGPDAIGATLEEALAAA